MCDIGLPSRVLFFLGLSVVMVARCCYMRDMCLFCVFVVVLVLSLLLLVVLVVLDV